MQQTFWFSLKFFVESPFAWKFWTLFSFFCWSSSNFWTKIIFCSGIQHIFHLNHHLFLFFFSASDWVIPRLNLHISLVVPIGCIFKKSILNFICSFLSLSLSLFLTCFTHSLLILIDHEDLHSFQQEFTLERFVLVWDSSDLQQMKRAKRVPGLLFTCKLKFIDFFGRKKKLSSRYEVRTLVRGQSINMINMYVQARVLMYSW